MTDKKRKGIGYYLVYGAFSLTAMLPFRILYFISDILYLLVYRLARYRRKVVRKNLRNSFPEKSTSELLVMEKEFYRHFCDYFVETIKTLRITDKEIRERMVFENLEVVEELTKDGNSCLMSMGHYGNWEWIPSLIMHLPERIKLGMVYKRLSSKDFDDLFLRIRSRFGPRAIEMKSIYRTIVQNRNEGVTMLIGFLNDQRPRKHANEYWVKFMNQDTLAQTGMERIASQMSFAVAYLDIVKVKRGHFRCSVSTITTDASKEEEYVITDRYTRKLEQTINNNPAYYLWTHNKWSRTKNTCNK